MIKFLDSEAVRKEKRLFWAVHRSVLENIGRMRKQSGKRSRSRWDLFLVLVNIFAVLLKMAGIYRKGYGNAKTITISEIALEFPNLPAAFNNFRILHLSDLHIDSIPGFAALIINKIKGIEFDMCLLNGDYRRDINGSFSHIRKPFFALSRYLRAPYGTFAVLGNHDTYMMTQYEKETGIDLLINESVEIQKDGEKILITGTDDPFYFFTEAALNALETSGYSFKIAMIHTSELAKAAARQKYDLYLCGHTHGGQVCLTEGRPLISHQYEGKQFNQGIWKIGNMTGYTSRGVGVSGLPVRYNCKAEITVITLKRAESR